MLNPSDSSNVYSDTGTAIHLAISKFHQGHDGLEAMHKASSTFPNANLEVAEAHFKAYSSDSRNQVEVRHVELPVEFSYKSVYITGTLDQIRVDAYDTHRVWDIKTGTEQPQEMATNYAVQIAAYTLAYASMHPKTKVLPGGIIRTAGYWYRKKPVDNTSLAPVFLPMTLSLDACRILMNTVVERVKEIRAGKVLFAPNSLICNRCEYKTPEICIPESLRLSLPVL